MGEIQSGRRDLTVAGSETVRRFDNAVLRNSTMTGSFGPGKRPKPTPTLLSRTGLNDQSQRFAWKCSQIESSTEGPGRQDNGNLHLSEFQVVCCRQQRDDIQSGTAKSTADFNQEGWDD